MALDIKGVSDTGMTVKLVSVADWCDIVNLNMYLILFFWYQENTSKKLWTESLSGKTNDLERCYWLTSVSVINVENLMLKSITLPAKS